MALGEVIETGWLLEEAIEDPSRPLNMGSGTNQYWARRLGVDFLNRRKQQVARIDTPHRVHLVSGLLDDFASQFATAAAVLQDTELSASAGDAADWSSHIRGKQRTIHEIYADLKLVLGELRQRQTALTLERLREG